MEIKGISQNTGLGIGRNGGCGVIEKSMGVAQVIENGCHERSILNVPGYLESFLKNGECLFPFSHAQMQCTQLIQGLCHQLGLIVCLGRFNGGLQKELGSLILPHLSQGSRGIDEGLNMIGVIARFLKIRGSLRP